MSQSYFLTRELCEGVFKRFLTGLLQKYSLPGRTAFALAVIDPTLNYERAEGLIFEDQDWSRVLLWEGSLGESQDMASYVANARLKALEALYHRESLKEVWDTRPVALRKGEIASYGGVYRNGIAAGGHGLHDYGDDKVMVDFAGLLHTAVKDSFPWTSRQQRINQIREWGGILPA